MPSVAQGLDGEPSGGEPVVSPYPQISGDGIQSQGMPWFARVNISVGANSPIRVHAGSVHAAAELNVASAWSAGFPSAPATGKMPD